MLLDGGRNDIMKASNAINLNLDFANAGIVYVLQAMEQ